jgi:Ser/Thr protein kinase RdoA (MazF antagonist)
MAVYTEVSRDDANQLLQTLGLGALTDLRGIRSGIENTNYFANTAQGQWVLTLFERLPREQLPYYLELMRHLAQRGIPVPAPQADAQGHLVHTLSGKPAAVVTRLPGSHRLAPGARHAEHQATADHANAGPAPDLAGLHEGEVLDRGAAGRRRRRRRGRRRGGARRSLLRPGRRRRRPR